MQVQRLTSLADFERHRERWNELAAGSPFRRWEWAANWWRNFHHGAALYVLQVTTPSGEIVGLAPWKIEHYSLSGRTIEPLGSGTACSEYLSILVDPKCRREVLTALAAWLIDAVRPGHADGWDMLQLDGVATNDPTLRELFGLLMQEGCVVDCQPGAKCWRIPLPSTWEEYLQRLPKPQRKRMRQAREALAPGGEFQTRIAEERGQWDEAWSRFVDLHQRRRKSLGQAGCFASTPFERFLRTAAEDLVQQGRSRLILVERNEQSVAALLTLSDGSIAYGYQMGTNPDCLADSPGWLVVCAALLAGLERQETALDLLRGDQAYKSRMGGVPQSMLQVRVVSPLLGPQWRHTALLTCRALKNYVKSGLMATRLAPFSANSECAV